MNRRPLLEETSILFAPDTIWARYTPDECVYRTRIRVPLRAGQFSTIFFPTSKDGVKVRLGQSNASCSSCISAATSSSETA